MSPTTEPAKTTEKPMAFAAFIPLITSAVTGITSLFGKNADADKAKIDLAAAQEAIKLEKEKTKQAGFTVDVAKLKLLEKREETAQLQVNNLSKEVKQKQSIGLISIGVVLVFLFGIGYLFVKFVLPIFYPKPIQEPQNVVIRE